MAEKQTLQIVSLLLMCALGVPLQIFSTNTKINITKNMPFYVLTLIIREGFIYIWNLGQIYRHLRSSPNTRVSSNQKGQIESDSTQKHYSNSRSRFWLVKAGRHLPHLDSWTKCNFHLTGVVMLCGEVPEKAPDGSFPWQSCGRGGHHHCQRTVHSSLLVLFSVFLLPSLSTPCSL